MALSSDERRARDAERKRRVRAAEREAREAARLAGRTSAESAASTATRDAVEATIAAARWLTAADAASIAQARTLAKRIDLLEHADETTRALSAHRALSQVLNDLGATATKRLQYELRSRRVAPAEDGDDERESSEGGATPANVTKLERPPKRRTS
ncbi:terminase small subunit [Microbacterium sp. No. 7]|uniref:terminase small subunit n=1 Tax=Microbacterium sp. No. 7 TaxID=1714373 RepID=UPI003FA55D95